MIKRIISLVLVIIISVLYFSSCGDKEKKTWYEMEYSQQYTPEYVYNNYYYCQLYYTQAATNPIGAQPDAEFWANRFKRYGDLYKEECGHYEKNNNSYWFFGIKNVPLEDYVAVCEKGHFLSNSYDMAVMRNKNLDVYELYDYTVIRAELRTDMKVKYWTNKADYDNVMSIISGEKDDSTVIKELVAGETQKHIIDNVKSGEYIEAGSMKPFGAYIDPERTRQPYNFTLRLYFEEYDNLFLELPIYVLKTINTEGVEKVRYYINCIAPKDHPCEVYIQVTEEIEKILSEYKAKGDYDKAFNIPLDK